MSGQVFLAVQGWIFDMMPEVPPMSGRANARQPQDRPTAEPTSGGGSAPGIMYLTLEKVAM